MRISLRLTLLVLLMATLPLAVSGYLAFDASRHALDEATRGRVAEINVSKKAEITRWLDAGQQVLAGLAQRPLVRANAAIIAESDPLSTMYRTAYQDLRRDHLLSGLEADNFTALSILRARDGQIVVSSAPASEGKYREHEPYFVRGLMQPYIDTVRHFPSEEIVALHFSQPILDRDGQVVAVLVGHANLAELTKILTQGSELSRSRDSFLVNESRFFVTEPRFLTDATLRHGNYSPVVSAALANGNGVAQYTDYRGTSVIGAHDWLPQLRVALVTEIDLSEAYGATMILGWTIAITALVVAVAAASTGLLFALSITRPIGELVAGAQEIGQGNLSYRIPMRRKDEIGWLARAYNLMATSLQRKEADLRDYTAKLEERVEERTAALQESETRFRSLVENSLDGIALHEIVTNEDGKAIDYVFLQINPAFERLTGLSAAEIIGKRVSEVLPGIEEEPFIEIYGRVALTGTPVRFEHDATQLGRTYEIAAYSPAPRHFATIFSDITERKRADVALRQQKELLQTILDTVPVMINHFDAAGRFQWANRGWERTMGWSMEEGRNGDSLAERCPDPATYEQVRAAIREASGKWIDGQTRTRSGAILETTWANVALSDGSRIGIGLDITERKQAEERLRETLRELERSNADLERFAYVASHDLQEPLRMVASYVQLLAMRYTGRLDDDADEFIGYAVDGAKRMQQLINDLLEYSRLGRRELSLRPVEGGQILAQALDNLQIAITEANATVTCDPLPRVMGDGSLLTLVFQNLIGNAIKFRNANPPHVHVSARLISGEAPSGGVGEVKRGGMRETEWQFSVRDNGIGIEPEYFERVFGLFQRLHSREKYPGTGIGLAVCKRIVERHDGRIWVTSEPGVGTTFHFTLSAADERRAT
jgi:PAS domain S-box-containing protein